MPYFGIFSSRKVLCSKLSGVATIEATEADASVKIQKSRGLTDLQVANNLQQNFYSLASR